MSLLQNTHFINFLKYSISIVIALLLTFASLEFVSRYVINWNQYEQTITENIEKIFGKGNVTIGKIEGSLFTPKIILYNTYLDYPDDESDFQSHNITMLPRMEMHISILSLLMWTPKVSEVIIRSADIYPIHVKKILSSYKTTSSIGIININKGSLKLESNIFRDIQFSDLKLDLDKELAISTTININNTNYRANFNLNNKKVSLSLNSDLLKASFSGTNQQGKLIINGDGISNSMNDIFKFIKFNEDIWDKFNASADIKWSSDDFKASNFILSSDSINTKGVVDFKYNEDFTNINLQVKNIHLDRLISGKKQNIGLLEFLQRYLEGGKSKNASGKVKIYIDETRFKKDIIKSIDFDANIDGRSTVINNFTLKMPGATDISVTGKILNNGMISRFEGQLSLISKDAQAVNAWLSSTEKISTKNTLKLQSNFLITPQIVSLTEAQLAFDDSRATLKLYIKNDLQNRKIRGEIDIDNLRLDNHNFLRSMMDGNQVYRINSDIDFDVELHNIYYQNNTFDNINLKILAETGKLFLQDINSQSDKVKLKADISLISQGIEPILHANINADYINSAIFQIPTILSIDQNPDNPKVTWLSKPISWFGLDKFNGKIIANIKKLDTSLLTLNNINADITLQDKLLSLNSFKSEAESGEIEATANIGMESDSSMFLSFSINNLEIKNIVKHLFDVDAITAGQFSCVGSIKSEGNSMEKLIKQASGKMKIAARAIKLKNFAADLLLDKVLDVKNMSELANLTKVSIFSGETDIEYFNAATNILNGLSASTARFKTQLSTGVLSSNLSLLDFQNKSIMQFFFMNKNNNTEVLSINMEMGGPVWLPKISFNEKNIYEMVKEKSSNKLR